MDPPRARNPGAAATRAGALKRWLAAAALPLACTNLLGDFGRIVAIEIEGSVTRRLEEADTLTLVAAALTAGGERVPDATIVWQVLDVDSGQVGLTLDTATGLVTAVFPSSVRIGAVVDDLRSDVITVTVTAAPDSLAAVEPTRVTVGPGETASPPLVTTLFDLTTTAGEQRPLSGKPVRFAVVEPATGPAATRGLLLTAGTDTVPGPDSLVATSITGTDGRATIRVRRVGTTQPDSAAIEATAHTATGMAVPGSPIRLIVVFQNQ